MSINLKAPSVIPTALLIGDSGPVDGIGSPDATPVFPNVGGVPVAASLVVDSTRGGFLAPRMTGLQIEALAPILPGMQVFCTLGNGANAPFNGGNAARGMYFREIDNIWHKVSVALDGENNVTISDADLPIAKQFAIPVFSENALPGIEGTDLYIQDGNVVTGIYQTNTTWIDIGPPVELDPTKPVYGMSKDRAETQTEGIGTTEVGTLTLWAAGEVQAKVVDGQLLSESNGTSVLPSFGFSNRPGLGMYTTGVAALAFAAGEYKQLEVVDNGYGDNFMQIGGSATGNPISIVAQGTDTNVSIYLNPKGNGQVLIDGGTQALPGLSFTGQTDMGIYKRAANSMAFIVSGGIISAFEAGQFLVQDGNATTPTFSFLGTTTTGLFKTNTNGLGITVEGSEVLRATSEQILLNGGSQEAPAFSFNGDPDIGLFRSATPGLGISVGGEQCAEFSESGLSLLNRAAPSGVADTVQLYSDDLTSGNTTLCLQTEGTPVSATVSTTPTQNIAIKVNGTTYYLMAKTIV